MRGAHTITVRDRGTRGIIPACTGSTTSIAAPSPLTRDHPRMCGEHCSGVLVFVPILGSSPHVRGALARLPAWRACHGIIPACAGSTFSPPFALKHRRDHPRMCGEHAYWRSAGIGPKGSSPHVRGAPACAIASVRTSGIIPACAGSTGGVKRLCRSIRDHPRMCGEHYGSLSTTATRRGSSPHVRGAHAPSMSQYRP